MTNSRRKGKEYELEIAWELRDHGLHARRGQQYSGANGDPDVVCEELPEYHLELKRRGDRFSAAELYDAMRQAVRDMHEGQVPVVIHRIDREESLATMKLSDWIELAKGGTDG